MQHTPPPILPIPYSTTHGPKPTRTRPFPWQNPEAPSQHAGVLSLFNVFLVYLTKSNSQPTYQRSTAHSVVDAIAPEVPAPTNNLFRQTGAHADTTGEVFETRDLICCAAGLPQEGSSSTDKHHANRNPSTRHIQPWPNECRADTVDEKKAHANTDLHPQNDCFDHFVRMAQAQDRNKCPQNMAPHADGT